MRRRALLCLADRPALVAFVALPGAANAQSTTAGPNAVTHWNRIAASTLVAIPGPAGGAPSALQINMGMTQGAVYDAINAITPKHHRPYLLNRRFSARASGEAAAATAAYRVLSNIVSTVPAGITFPNRARLLQSLADAIRHVARGDTGLAVQDAGDRRGERRRRRDDRRPGGRRTLRAVAVGPEPGSGALAAAVAERDVAARPDSVGRRRATVPAAELVAVPHRRPQRAARAPRTRRTSTRSRRSAATAWRPPRPARPTRRTTRSSGRAREARPCCGTASRANLAEDPAHALDLADSCPPARDDEPERRGRGDQLLERQVPLRLLAAVAGDPPSGPGRQPATEADPNWTPLLTAPYPDHPSGHLCLDGAHLRVLQMFFGTDDDALRRHEQPVRRRDALLRPVLAAAGGDHRSPHLGGPALPHRRRAGAATSASTSPSTWPTTTSSRSAEAKPVARGRAFAAPRERPPSLALGTSRRARAPRTDWRMLPPRWWWLQRPPAALMRRPEMRSPTSSSLG